MPIYEYRCRKCNKDFEAIQRSSEGPGDIVCPACGTKNPEKLISSCCAPSSGKAEGPSHGSSCGVRKFG
jgi:putative FmdB family regulatory protein